MPALTLRRRRCGAAAVAAAALLVAGCGSSNASSSASAGSSVDGAAISRAADISGAEKGEKVAYSMTAQLPSLGKLAISGTGSFNNSPATGQMTLKVAVANASSLGAEASILSNLQLQLVISDNSFYIKLPSSLASMASSFTNGKQWLTLDVGQLASNSKIPGLSSMLGGQAMPTDPAATLKELDEASTDGVTKVGPATVNGAQTTEYKATLDLDKLSSTLPAAERTALKPQLALLSKQAGLSKIPFEVYIDSAKLVRRLTLDFTVKADGNSVPLTLNEDFLAYGSQPAPTIPPAADTDNLDSLIASMGTGTGTSTTGSGSLLGG